MAVKQGTGKNKILLWIKAGSGICSIKWGGSIKSHNRPVNWAPCAWQIEVCNLQQGQLQKYCVC